MGININQSVFPEAIKNPVSLKQITGKDHNVIELAKELCTLLNKNLQHLFSGREDFILKKYNEVLYKRNEIARLKQGAIIFSGLVKEVDNSGKLIVQSGIEQSFESGSLEWIH